ncbi:4-carboxymuconolactone decarboxylase [Lutibaculum baratangense]|uniref:4-carboxymuconolactone decarboxylase n=1 Tax=Lutibaculum baratangense AMV1 TaxID=631454 RepID=V4RGS1_9HYPH|nr:4-carboxymuconolactone decarboxylase [Lutibaculum baratangense]ESR22465.1 4-carboxymuconolactone decarboxylase [Lutibaculum baratangense AMV1]
MNEDDRHAAGMRNRRSVLGDAHVDRAEARKTPFDERFQHFITRNAWGDIWESRTIDRKTRSLLTMAMLLAMGHEEEFAMHVRASVNCGVTEEELSDLLMQAAIYCGVPAANSGYRIAKSVLAERAADSG